MLEELLRARLFSGLVVDVRAAHLGWVFAVAELVDLLVQGAHAAVEGWTCEKL